MNHVKPHTQPHPMDVHVGERLRGRREELDLSPSEVGRAIGETGHVIEKFEGGRRTVSAGQLYQLGRLYNVDVNYFFCKMSDGDGDGGAPSAGTADKEAGRFLRAFFDVPDPELRRCLLSLARSVAEGDDLGRDILSALVPLKTKS